MYSRFLPQLLLSSFSFFAACADGSIFKGPRNSGSNKKEVNARSDLNSSADSNLPSAVVYGNNIQIVENMENLSQCSDQKIGSLAYVKEAKRVFICQGTWTEFHFSGNNGFDGKAGSDALMSKPSEEPPGERCHYGGKKVTAGVDLNSDGKIENTEIKSELFMCEGNIEKISREIFAKYVHSVALVRATWKVRSTDPECVNLPQEMDGSGTGWLINKTNVVTNHHVVRMSVNSIEPARQKCYRVENNFIPADTIEVFFPKKSLAADDLMRKGLPNYSGWKPSLIDFDKVEVKLANSTGADPILPADLSILTISEQKDRDPFIISKQNPSSPAPSTLRAGDELVRIGYDLTNGPRLTRWQSVQIQSCSDWQGSNSFCLDYLIRPESRVIVAYGYGDHGGSGSPVLDRFGEVVGLFTWGQNVALSISTPTSQVIFDIKKHLPLD